MRRTQPISRSHADRARYLFGFSLLALLLIPFVASNNPGNQSVSLLVFLASTPLLWAAWRAYLYLDDTWYHRVVGVTAATFGLMVSPWLLLVALPYPQPLDEFELLALTAIAAPVSGFVFVRIAVVARRQIRRILPPRAS